MVIGQCFQRLPSVLPRCHDYSGKAYAQRRCAFYIFWEFVPLQALLCIVILRSLCAELFSTPSQDYLRIWRVSCRPLRATARLLGSTSRQLLGSGQQHASCRSAGRPLQQHLHCADGAGSAGPCYGDTASKPGEDALAAAIYAHSVALHCLQVRQEM